MPKFNTPMMIQYGEIKEQYANCLLFFRLGDFYELFLEDAKIGANVLNITLTRRPRGKDGEIPMAGVPFHSADSYIAKLVDAGYKVAICEQISEPDNKGIVEREVVRIVTPGTIMDEKALNQKEHNYTMSFDFDDQEIGFAFADISTGDIFTTQIKYKNNFDNLIINELTRFNPKECILDDKKYHNPKLLKLLRNNQATNLYLFADWQKNTKKAYDFLLDNFKIKNLRSFGLETQKLSQRALAPLIDYLKYTQKNRIKHIRSIKRYNPKKYVYLDKAAITNLEVFKTLRDHDLKGSLLGVIDQTKTAMGGRKLKTWLEKPLNQKEKINERLEAVEIFLERINLRKKIIQKLKLIADIPRLIGRLSVEIGNAYDLINLKNSLIQIKKIKKLINKNKLKAKIFEKFNLIDQKTDTIIDLIKTKIQNDPPIDLKNGGLIKDKVDKKLDKLRDLVKNSKTWIAKKEKEEREKTKINSLKIKFNKIFGYYIEVSKPNLHLIPKDYFRKQTMVNAERFITPELKKHEEIILTAEENINKIELEIFQKTVAEVLVYTELLQKITDLIAQLDCLINFSVIAENNDYTKPQINESDEIEIKNGRHPVVEQISENQFIANDTKLNNKDHQLIIITGPNMAGKSVYMRQVALIVLLAHLGSYVPADQAKIGLVDKIFVRSGASDLISQGLSTFMVEMIETAYILNNATSKSLIIMDEIGRGTSTYDGISIAWSIARHLVKNKKIKAKTLFATHYHELQELEEKYPDSIKNYHLAIEEKKKGDPVFLHQIKPGKSSHSFAIAVAKLAGLPEKVTQKAQKILNSMEKKHRENSTKQTIPLNLKEKRSDLDNKKIDPKTQKILQKISKLRLYDMTPLEALNYLSKLQKKTIKLYRK
jgi:DNA mismatch repair protein MutS